MSFMSMEFMFFFVVLLLGLKMTRGMEKHRAILLVASYVFYFLGDARFLVILIFISFSSWYIGKRIGEDRINAKKYLIIAIFIDLMVLSVFKYFNFFMDNFCKLLGDSWVTVNIILPIGISFYIFQAISYVVDIYNGKIEAEKSLVKILLYIGFFPQIVSGPIMKAHEFLPQLDIDHEITGENLSYGIQRFMTGIFKKMVVADRLSVCVNAVYSAPACYSGISIMLAVLSYTLEIYYDFAGYSDMAIGIAAALGFELKTNFNLPYLAKTPSEFWKRWHISLSSWLGEYVYISLGGNRKGKIRTYINLFITMLLSGIWHGANWGFILWGILHAGISVIYKIFVDIKKKYNIFTANKMLLKMVSAFSTMSTFIIVTLLWVPFRSHDLRKTKLIYSRLFMMSEGINYNYIFTFVFFVFLLIVEIIAVKRNNGNDIWRPLNLNRFSGKVIFLSFIFLTFLFAYIGDNAFIYANF